MKAIVIDIINNEAALLKEDGSMLKVADQNYQIGEEVMLESSDTGMITDIGSAKSTNNTKDSAAGNGSHYRKIKRRVIASALAAAMLLGISICAYAMPYGKVIQGKDSSIEYTINMFDRVIDVHANDELGEAVLKEAGDLKNMKINEAVEMTAAAGTSISIKVSNEAHEKKLNEELTQAVSSNLKEQIPSSSYTDSVMAEHKTAAPSGAQEKPFAFAPSGNRPATPSDLPDGSAENTGISSEPDRNKPAAPPSEIQHNNTDNSNVQPKEPAEAGPDSQQNINSSNAQPAVPADNVNAPSADGSMVSGSQPPEQSAQPGNQPDSVNAGNPPPSPEAAESDNSSVQDTAFSEPPAPQDSNNDFHDDPGQDHGDAGNGPGDFAPPER